jgi:hypothetical protein
MDIAVGPSGALRLSLPSAAEGNRPTAAALVGNQFVAVAGTATG